MSERNPDSGQRAKADSKAHPRELMHAALEAALNDDYAGVIEAVYSLSPGAAEVLHEAASTLAQEALDVASPPDVPVVL